MWVVFQSWGLRMAGFKKAIEDIKSGKYDFSCSRCGEGCKRGDKFCRGCHKELNG